VSSLRFVIAFHTLPTDAETSPLECIWSSAATAGTPYIVILAIKAATIMVEFFVPNHDILFFGIFEVVAFVIVRIPDL
jgi:hypothetical protein